MMRKTSTFIILLVLGILFLYSRNHSHVAAAKTDLFGALIPLHEVKKTPGPYDWMATHPEPGQTFADFINLNPRKPQKGEKIYIVLLGNFDQARKQIIGSTAEFVEGYFGLPVEFLKSVPLDAAPAHAQRNHPSTGDHQFLTSYLIEDVLIPMRPNDAYCLIGFAASDLWPGQGWNFVFGQASIEDRVGVWSIYRNGDPNKDEDRKLCLLRTVKTGTHEIGHMFGLHHCIYYECNMNGSNHRKESDARPLALCPVCLKKLDWMMDYHLVKRYERLMQLSESNDLIDEIQFFRKLIKAIESIKETE